MALCLHHLLGGGRLVPLLMLGEEGIRTKHRRGSSCFKGFESDWEHSSGLSPTALRSFIDVTPACETTIGIKMINGCGVRNRSDYFLP
jgi:hypothetical protein